MENELEDLDSQNQEEQDDSLEETLAEELPEEPDVNQELEKLKEQNAKLYARAKKAEEKVAKVPSTEKVEKGDEEFRPRVEFLLTNRDVNQEEYDHLAAVALRNSGKITFESLQEAKKSESDYISYLRKKTENKSKTPSSTSASGYSKFQKSSEDIAKMTSAEHQKYEEQMMRSGQGI